MSPIDPHARTVLDLMASQPALDTLSSSEAKEAAHVGFIALQGPKTAVSDVRDLRVELASATIDLRVYRPPGASAGASLPACVYFHGGGFVIGDLEMYDVLCRALCAESGRVLVSVDYRLAPEARFPAAVDDCWAATCWVAAHADSLGIDVADLAVAGDSAGGNLAAVVALMARDRGAPRLSRQLLIYPALDLHGGTDSYRANGEGYFLTRTLMDWFLQHYTGGRAELLDDWRASPLRAGSHAGLPPATILVCGYDPLHDDGLAYAERLEAAGVATRLLRVPEQIHGFLSMDGLIPAAAFWMRELGRSLSAPPREPGL